MRKRTFRYADIDGFVGAGYHVLGAGEGEAGGLLAELDAPAAAEVLDGPAGIALQVEP